MTLGRAKSGRAGQDLRVFGEWLALLGGWLALADGDARNRLSRPLVGQQDRTFRERQGFCCGQNSEKMS